MTDDKQDFSKILEDFKSAEQQFSSSLSSIAPKKKDNTWVWGLAGIGLVLLVIMLVAVLAVPQLVKYVEAPVNGPVFNATTLQNLTDTKSLLENENVQLRSLVETLKKEANVTLVPQSSNPELQKKFDAELESNKNLIEQNYQLQQKLENLTKQIAEKTVVKEIIREPTTIVQTSGSFVDIDQNTPITKIITSSIFPNLKEGKISFRGRNIGYKESVELKDIIPTFTTNLAVDEEFRTDLSFVNERGMVAYIVQMDEPVFFTELNDDNPLKINFAGTELEIVKAKINGITYSAGENRELAKDEEMDIDGVTIKLMDTTDLKAVFRINGELVIMAEGDSKTVSGIDINLKSVINTDSLKIAQFRTGKEVNKEVLNGDKYEQDGNYSWVIRTNGEQLLAFGVKYDQRNTDRKDVVLKENMPFNVLNYFSITPTWNQDPKYNRFSASLDKFGQSATPMMKLRSDDGNRFLVQNVLLNEIWVRDGKVKYINTNNQEVTVDNNASIQSGDVELPITSSGSLVKIGKFLFLTDGEKIGTIKNTDEAIEIIHDGSQIGLRDDVMSPDGIKLSRSENDEKFTLLIPSRKLMVRFGLDGDAP